MSPGSWRFEKLEAWKVGWPGSVEQTAARCKRDTETVERRVVWLQVAAWPRLFGSVAASWLLDSIETSKPLPKVHPSSKTGMSSPIPPKPTMVRLKSRSQATIFKPSIARECANKRSARLHGAELTLAALLGQKLLPLGAAHLELAKSRNGRVAVRRTPPPLKKTNTQA